MWNYYLNENYLRHTCLYVYIELFRWIKLQMKANICMYNYYISVWTGSGSDSQVFQQNWKFIGICSAGAKTCLFDEPIPPKIWSTSGWNQSTMPIFVGEYFNCTMYMQVNISKCMKTSLWCSGAVWGLQARNRNQRVQMEYEIQRNIKYFSLLLIWYFEFIWCSKKRFLFILYH